MTFSVHQMKKMRRHPWMRIKLNKKQNHEAAVFLKFYQRGIVEQNEDPCTLVQMTIKGQTINESISKSNNDNLEDIRLKTDKKHIIPKFTGKPG